MFTYFSMTVNRNPFYVLVYSREQLSEGIDLTQLIPVRHSQELFIQERARKGDCTTTC